jgi:hypothetical protein
MGILRNQRMNKEIAALFALANSGLYSLALTLVPSCAKVITLRVRHV